MRSAIRRIATNSFPDYNKLNALLTVKNLTNKYFSEVGAVSLFRNDIGVYPMPGTQFFLRVEYAFGG